MKKLLMTVGLPRSGKSTWARSKEYPIVNPDSIRLALHGQAYIKDSEKMVWAITEYMVKALFLAGHNIVILDATNITEASRKIWKQYTESIEYHVFNTEFYIIEQRAKETNFPMEVINKMVMDFEDISVSELRPTDRVIRHR